MPGTTQVIAAASELLPYFRLGYIQVLIPWNPAVRLYLSQTAEVWIAYWFLKFSPSGQSEVHSCWSCAKHILCTSEQRQSIYSVWNLFSFVLFFFWSASSYRRVSQIIAQFIDACTRLCFRAIVSDIVYRVYIQSITLTTHHLKFMNMSQPSVEKVEEVSSKERKRLSYTRQVSSHPNVPILVCFLFE